MRVGNYVLIALLCGLCFPFRGLTEEVSRKPADEETLVARLAAQVPEEPTTIKPELVALIYEVGATKRLDAAMVLIRALSLSFSPIGSGEHRSPFGLLPAAEALRSNFGASALPLLMYKGVTSDKPWLQIRIAVTMRGLGSEAEIQGVREAFSVSEKSNTAAQKFSARLAARELQLDEDPVLSLSGQIDQMIEKALEEKRKSERERKPPGH